MKTLQECKDEVARNHGYDDWRSKIYENGDNMMEMLWEEVVKLYMSEACREQREICAQAYEHSSTFVNQYNSVTKNDVKNAPEPTMI